MGVDGERHAGRFTFWKGCRYLCLGGCVDASPEQNGTAKYLASTAIRSPDRLARGLTLYRLPYPGLQNSKEM